MASDDRICRILQEESDIEAAVYGLMALANDSGGKDSVTLILIKVSDRMARVPALLGRQTPG